MPGTDFNKGRNKLFFFWSQDILARTDPGNLNQRRMPTALERRGDFSQTFDGQGRLIFIRDPQLAGNCSATGAAARPASPATSSRRTGSTRSCRRCSTCSRCRTPPIRPARGQYNYAFQTVQDWPRNDQVLRMDWNVADKTTFYSRVQFGYEKRAGGVIVPRLTAAAGRSSRASTRSSTVSYVNTLLHTFNPTTFSELTVGVNWAHQYTQRARPGGAGRQRPHARPARVPAVLPVGEPGQPPAERDVQRRRMPGTIAPFNVDNRWPFFGYNTLWNFSGNITKIRGAHNMKTGLFVEHTTRPAQRASTFNGVAQLQHRRFEPAQHERRLRQRAARRRHRSTRSRTATRRRTASS